MKIHCGLLAGLSSVAAVEMPAADLRIGIIGCDTSHPGAFKGGSQEIDESWFHVNGYTKPLQEKHGVKMVDSVAAFCREVDVVIIESIDGRPRWKRQSR